LKLKTLLVSLPSILLSISNVMADVKAEDEIPFLSQSSSSEELDVRSKKGSLKRFIYLQVGLLLLYSIIGFAIFRVLRKGYIAESPIALVSTEYSPQIYLNLNRNSFTGSPSVNPHVDESWSELIKNINIRVSAEELERNHQSSVELPENGGYLAWMSVYHELHCLKVLRQWGYKEHYFANMTKQLHGEMEMHTDHCVEYLRQASMCHADTSLVVFEWSESKAKPMLKNHRDPHMCKDWATIEVIAKDRQVTSGEFSRLINPIATPK